MQFRIRGPLIDWFVFIDHENKNSETLYGFLPFPKPV